MKISISAKQNPLIEKWAEYEQLIHINSNTNGH